MKRTLLGLTIALTLPFAAANAEHGNTSIERGRVLDATPIYQVVQVPESREVCYDEEVRYRRPTSAAPTILGAIVGGAVGNRIGDGNGRRAMTVAGAALGAAVGHDAARRRGHGYTQVETHCEVRRDYRDEERIVGYRVDYEYNGQVYTTRTDRDPGRYIDLRVSVSPVSP